MLTAEQVAFYHDSGFVRAPQVFAPERMEALADELDRVTDAWAEETPGWVGPWRRVYMDEETERRSTLVAANDFHIHDGAWLQAILDPAILDCVAQLLGPVIELHHTTLHHKPPQTGHPFPMHQDSPFYQHADGRYVDALVHLDDTCHANGEIRFMPGSHKLGHLEHVLETADGPCTPHLPTDRYSLADTVPVPARRGDVVFFSIYTIHGSYINTTDRIRRMVRVGYRDPSNAQIGGHAVGQPGLMLRGMRPRVAVMA
ncbi:MAG: phytanoyl-CoA dioxygenase family protein [Armatimonadetes bacterium]|nr:phytanoyl-CoA dioxygenase family protein [Armatimonadota bacterium]